MRIQARRPRTLREWRAVIGAILLIAGSVMQWSNLVPQGLNPAVELGFILFWIGLALFWPSIIKILRCTDRSGAGRDPGFPAWIISITLGAAATWLLPSIVFVATSGSAAALRAEADAFYKDPSSIIEYFELFIWIAIFGILAFGPDLVRRKLSLRDASESAQSLIPACIAAGATAATCAYLFLLHFSDGPLSDIKPGPLVAAILAIAVLVTPFYRFIARTCWKYGIIDALDPATWRAIWGNVWNEIFGPPSDHSADNNEFPVDVAMNQIKPEVESAVNEDPK